MNTFVKKDHDEWNALPGRLHLLESCFSQLKDIILIIAVDSGGSLQPRIVLVNDAYEKAFGFERAQVVGRDPWFQRGPNTDLAIIEELDRALQCGEALTCRLLLYDQHHREHGVEVGLVPTTNVDVASRFFVAHLRLLAESRAQEEALRLSGERFSLAFEYGPIGMALVAPEGQWLTANRALCEMLGYRADELAQKTFQRLTHANDLEAELELIRRTLEGETHFYQIEKRFLRKNGHSLWAHLTSSLVRDSDGNPLYFIEQIQNITDSKRASEKIAEQAALLDKTHDAIAVCDLDGKILFWNKGAESTYGWAPEEAAGRRMRDLIFRDNQVRYEDAHRLTLAAQKWAGELVAIHKDGRELTVQSHWTLIRDKNERPKSFLVTSYDITDHKKIEAQLLRAQRMESIGTLAGGIAHDLNNILTPIMMSIEMLKETSSNPRALSILETIEMTAQRGADIVRQVLSFARGIIGDRVEVQPRHLLKDIRALIEETLPKNIQLQYFFPHESWTILGDPTQLHQILMNLCVNARDAMPNGGTLTIQTENTVVDEQCASMHLGARAGPYVVIKVTDTGTGIPVEILDKIFEPFFTTKEIGKGTGLGLSTVIAIVKSHEGFVHVDSKPRQGTTFQVYLPATEGGALSSEEVSGISDLPRGRGETILVIDDEASILTITSQTLEAFGYRTLTASDGVEAVAIYAAQREQIGVVLTDMAMPILDGPATIRVLVKMNPQAVIIAASGLKDAENLAADENAGIKCFLSKPYTASALLKTLRSVLDKP